MAEELSSGDGSSRSVIESSTYFTAKQELSSASIDSTGCASSSDPTPLKKYLTEYLTARLATEERSSTDTPNDDSTGCGSSSDPTPLKKYLTEYLTARLAERSSTSVPKVDSTGCGSSSDPALLTEYLTEYLSARIQTVMESRREFEAEMEVSKQHWSQLESDSDDDDDEYSAETNLALFHSLRKQYANNFFQYWPESYYALGEKIAEGAQGEIYTVRFARPADAHKDTKLVVKVFKPGFSLRTLQKQWPHGMLQKAVTDEHYSTNDTCAPILRGYMMKDGRFMFMMQKFWGDLRKLIDLRNNNKEGPPFSDVLAFSIMRTIASGMRGLHRDDILHRDLKASNLLLWLLPSPGNDEQFHKFDPLKHYQFVPTIADFECSVGVVGTRFWRAPEILLGIKNGDVQPSLFTKESDVYSYAMTCYEVLTGCIPLQGLRPTDYDAVLQGARPVLPSSVSPWIQSLMSRCWHHDPSMRPSFEGIMEEFIEEEPNYATRFSEEKSHFTNFYYD